LPQLGQVAYNLELLIVTSSLSFFPNIERFEFIMHHRAVGKYPTPMHNSLCAVISITNRTGLSIRSIRFFILFG
jgi:hypothetical protein